MFSILLSQEFQKKGNDGLEKSLEWSSKPNVTDHNRLITCDLV